MPLRSKVLILLGFLSLCIIWGSTFLAIRLALDSMPPFAMSAVRFVTAGAVLCLFSRAGGWKITATEWKQGFISGALLFLGGNGAVVWAEQTLSSGLAALIISTIPLWFMVLQYLMGEKPRVILLLGVVAGMSGIAVLIGPTQIAGANPIDWYVTAILLAGAFSWAGGSLYARQVSGNFSLGTAGVQMLCGGICLAVAHLISGEFRRLDLNILSTTSIMALLFLIFVGSVFAYSIYLWLLKTISPSLVATYAFFNPIVAIFLGAAILHEPLNDRIVAASLLILLGVAITVFGTAFSRKRARVGDLVVTNSAAAKSVRNESRAGNARRAAG